MPDVILTGHEMVQWDVIQTLITDTLESFSMFNYEFDKVLGAI